jgi:hypothetical protein
MADGIFTTHVKHVELEKPSTVLPFYPFGDMHRDSKACDVGRWKNFLREYKSHEKALSLCLGDTNDFASFSGRKKIDKADMHDEEMNKLDTWVMIDEDVVFDEMGFMGDDCLGLVEGNHGWLYSSGPYKGRTSAESLADRMGCPYLGDLAYIRVAFSFKNTNKQAHIDILACHGKAGGKLLGTSVNQIADLMPLFPMVDIYIMGHDHQRYGHPTSTMFVQKSHGADKLIVKQKRQWLCRSGSFLKVFEEDVPSYMIGRYKKPNELGIIRLDMSFIRSCSGGHDVLMPDIHCYM